MSADASRVFVTGMGAVSCVGIGIEDFWDAVLAGEPRFQRIERFDVDGSSYDAGGIIDDEQFSGGGANVSLAARFAGAAAEEAVADLPGADRSDLAVILGTNFGPSEWHERLLEPGEDLPSDGDLCEGFFVRDVDHVAESIGARGERINMSLSCSSGNAALAHALDLIRSGRAEAVLAGGYDSIQKIIWGGLACLRVMTASKEGMPLVRPFDADRSGTLFSEGAGLLLVESAEHARSRGAEPLAELAGAGSNNNAYHMTHADKEGRATAEAIRMALDDARVGPEEVDHFNAHGTGTKLNDVIETRALKNVFGDRATGIPVTSIKGGLGHAMGAASSLESIASVRTLQAGLIPPTSNYETPDPECDLDIVAGAPRECDARVVVNNSAGIGGANAAVTFRRVE